AFGGASLTRAEPHAFVSYYCLRSLKGMEETLSKQGMEHRSFAQLLSEIATWCEGGNSSIRLAYSKLDDFRVLVSAELARLRDAVGLQNVVTALAGKISGELVKPEVASVVSKA